ncbi:MAG: serine/threonine-protein kinase, partial [Acidobacteriota bacterium]|nr:serine/threonine-protein kinase [Acidobacteriota bacterium]
MPLSAGTRLGPYEIVALRGAGGMGEVYRARDTRLDRTVAIKILPSADPELKARFEREGKAIAALTHPHICTLFDVGHQDGTDYLVMEYLEGETLADKLQRGPLKVDDAFKVAIEIADALDKAHRAGIVHRDLKPANIMLTKSGAKLLDFGLAKPRAAFLTGALRETMTRDQLSGTGTIAGTLHYMAPEQFEGRDPDARTDIWGFGCVLYEMITGRKQFAGATPTAVLAMILERDPPPPSTLQPLAAGMDRVVQKCVSRDPDARWQSVSDLRDELTWIAGGGASVIVHDASRRQRWSLLLAGALSGAALAALAILLARPWSAPSAQTEVTRLELTLPRLSSDESTVLSPDGKQLAFIAPNLQGQPMLWVRRLAEATARPLPGTEGAHAPSTPFWAPDGHALAFVAARKIKTIELAG